MRMLNPWDKGFMVRIVWMNYFECMGGEL